MKVFLEFDFDKFEREVLRKPKTLDALDNLDGKVIDFAKYYHNLTEDERVEYEERSAIIEYDGGLSRQEAEKQAIQNIIYMRDYKNER
ncbi:MAG: hypothetical protein PQ612_00040 [Rickettsiales bacterium]|nr:hypothetical protein [Pseudomonadota bacterium]MDA0965694.1 hypothetical protein [Pseudomonadota bacterium]MDG4543018.1 hypothetical protein [Rickettsiales bacterium]MDG4544534.1 hypothetical protein [Rickettsiales bacterium]MDG4546656.1 hypothetical protein [Rickettsiales bacterium]